jgi:hypothetical protein
MKNSALRRGRQMLLFAVALGLLFLAATGTAGATPPVPDDDEAAASTLAKPAASLQSPQADGCFVSAGRGRAIHGTDNGVPIKPWAGILITQIQNQQVPAFCLDLDHDILAGDCFTFNGPTSCEVSWLLNNYPPDFSLGVKEAASRQAAIWYYSDNFVVTSPPEIVTRTQEILNAVPKPCNLPINPPQITLAPSSGENTLPLETTHLITVTVTQDGQPAAGKVIQLTTNFGTLSALSVTTDQNGQASFTLTSVHTGTATITATLGYSLILGTTLMPSVDKQKLGIPTPQQGTVNTTATKTWIESGGPTGITLTKFRGRVSQPNQMWALALPFVAGGAWFWRHWRRAL